MIVEPWCWGGGGGWSSHPLQLTTGLVVNSFVITSPVLAGERMLLIPKVSILSEQILELPLPHNKIIICASLNTGGSHFYTRLCC